MTEDSANRKFFTALARAIAGALIFSLPLLMTMEMWFFGFYLDRLRLVLLFLLTVPLLIRLSYHVGFEDTFSLIEDAVDAFAAFAVGFITAAVTLSLIGVLRANMTVDEVIGKIALQAVAGAFGAILAQSQFNNNQEEKQRKEERAGYFGELFLMLAGALFIALNIAPTEEMILIAYRINDWQAVGLAVGALMVLHAFVYSVEFRGQHTVDDDTSQPQVFVKYTVAGYAIVLLMSFYILWTFGRTDGVAAAEVVKMTVVLGLPAAVGAAAARLIL